MVIPINIVLSGAQSAAGQLGAMSAAGASVQTRLQGIGALGGTIGGIGGEFLSMADAAVQADADGKNVEARLNSILKAQGRVQDMATLLDAANNVAERGHFVDPDELTDATVKLLSFNTQTQHTGDLLELAARQARTMGGDVGGVAVQLGKVYNTGQGIAGLKKSGVTLDQSDIDRLEKAYKLSKEAGQAEFMTTIGKAIRDNTVAIEDSLSDVQAKANDAQRAMDDAQANMGAGASAMKASFLQASGALVMMANQAPALEGIAGGLGYIAGMALSTGGSILQLSSQIGMVALAFPGLMTSAGTVFASIQAGAIASASGLMTMAASAWTAAAGMAAAFAPVLIALAAVVALAGAAYLWWKKFGEGAQLDKNIEVGKGADKQLFDIENARRRKHGEKELTAAEWARMQGNDDGTSSDDSGIPDIDALKKLTAVPASAPVAPPTMPAMPTAASLPVVAPPSALTTAATAEQDAPKEVKARATAAHAHATKAVLDSAKAGAKQAHDTVKKTVKPTTDTSAQDNFLFQLWGTNPFTAALGPGVGIGKMGGGLNRGTTGAGGANRGGGGVSKIQLPDLEYAGTENGTVIFQARIAMTEVKRGLGLTGTTRGKGRG